MSDSEELEEAIKNKYTKNKLMEIGVAMQPAVILKSHWDKSKMVRILIEKGYRDEDDATESELDENENNNHNNNAPEQEPDDDNHNHNHNNNAPDQEPDDDNHENDNHDHNAAVREKNDEKNAKLYDKINKGRHNIHCDWSCESLNNLIKYQKWRRIMSMRSENLENAIKGAIINHLNANEPNFELKEENISISITATRKPVKNIKYNKINKKDKLKQGTWRAGQANGCAKRLDTSLKQIGGAGILLWYDIQGKADGAARKPKVKYFGAFKKKKLKKLRKAINEKIDELIKASVEECIAEKNKSNKAAACLHELKNKLDALKKKKEEMDPHEFHAQYHDISEKILNKQEKNHRDNDEEAENERKENDKEEEEVEQDEEDDEQDEEEDEQHEEEVEQDEEDDEQDEEDDELMSDEY